MKIAIVGAGLIGRILALQLSRKGHRISVYDKDTRAGAKSCTWTGAGMLAPYCELERAENIVGQMGIMSLELWPKLLDSLAAPVSYKYTGSLMVSHPNDRSEMLRLKRTYDHRLADLKALRQVDAKEVGELEPELAGRFHEGLFFPHEGWVDNRELLTALGLSLEQLQIEWHEGVEFGHLGSNTLDTPSDKRSYDWVLDCRGLGGQVDLPELRGVRGELLHIRAPEVHLNRPVRLMHPRYPIYIVPRRDGRYVIGATSIESQDLGEATVRSLLELLSAAYTVHTGFAEARVVDISVNCRPALPDNQPRLFLGKGLLRVNGLYRHGFLISPILAEWAMALVETGKLPEAGQSLVREL